MGPKEWQPLHMGWVDCDPEAMNLTKYGFNNLKLITLFALFKQSVTEVEV